MNRKLTPIGGYGDFKYGEGIYGEDIIAIDGSDKEGFDFMSYLPYIYNQSGVNNRRLLNSVVGSQHALALKHAYDIQDQRAVEKATWGLYRWEKELDLPTELISMESRRQRIFAKLGGRGRTTNRAIMELAENTINTTVKVGEDFERFHTDIIISGMKGEPENMNFFIDMLEEIIPAHLTFRVLTTKLTWDEFDAYGYTFDEWDSKNLSWDEFEIYEER